MRKDEMQIFFKKIGYEVRLYRLKKNAGSATLWSQMNVFDEIKKCEKWVNHLKKQINYAKQ